MDKTQIFCVIHLFHKPFRFGDIWTEVSEGAKIFNLVTCYCIWKFAAHVFPFRLCTYNFRIFNFNQNIQFRIFHFIHMSSVKFTILLTSCTTFLPTRPLDVCHFANLPTRKFPSVSHLASCIAIRKHIDSVWHFLRSRGTTGPRLKWHSCGFCCLVGKQSTNLRRRFLFWTFWMMQIISYWK
jgi:hypothetical protein